MPSTLPVSLGFSVPTTLPVSLVPLLLGFSVPLQVLLVSLVHRGV